MPSLKDNMTGFTIVAIVTIVLIDSGYKKYNTKQSFTEFEQTWLYDNDSSPTPPFHFLSTHSN